MNDTISRKAAIDTLFKMYCKSDEDGYVWIIRGDACLKIDALPPIQSESCEGCKHLGKWENEVEYGYSSPCTHCKRKAEDYYER